MIKVRTVEAGVTVLTEMNNQFPMLKADAYFFDIDGTLLVSRDLVHWNAMHRAMLEVYGLDANLDGIPYHGKTDVAILLIPCSTKSYPRRLQSYEATCPRM
jgi:hypothetical protein